jgi:hypothetical protein
MKIAILGCGPSGMFAAHAAAEEGHTVRIFSIPNKTSVFGGKYLRSPIPGLAEDKFKIDYRTMGSLEKIEDRVGEVVVGVYDGWNLRSAYWDAWDKYRNLILPWDAQRDWIPQTFDMVFSTIPAPLLCLSNDKSGITVEEELEGTRCKFSSETILSVSGTPRVLGSDKNVILCTGGDEFWFRASRINGQEITEYKSDILDRFPRIAIFGYGQSVRKTIVPSESTCTCRPEIVRSGTYGLWSSEALSHESYDDMKEAIR